MTNQPELKRTGGRKGKKKKGQDITAVKQRCSKITNQAVIKYRIVKNFVLYLRKLGLGIKIL